MEPYARIFAWSGALSASYLVVSLVLIKAARLPQLPVLIVGAVVVGIGVMTVSIRAGLRDRERLRHRGVDGRPRASR